jgi:hypothetical protein
MRTRAFVWVVMLGGSLPISGCTRGAPTAVAPITTVTLDSGIASTSPVTTSSDPSDAAVASADAGGDFFSCASDSDCVTVPKNSCCNNGFLEAVNKLQADAYKASFTCERRRMCPQFRIRDTRTPHCNADAHKCELVKADGSGLPTTP